MSTVVLRFREPLNKCPYASTAWGMHTPTTGLAGTPVRVHLPPEPALPGRCVAGEPLWRVVAEEVIRLTGKHIPDPSLGGYQLAVTAGDLRRARAVLAQGEEK